MTSLEWHQTPWNCLIISPLCLSVCLSCSSDAIFIITSIFIAFNDFLHPYINSLSISLHCSWINPQLWHIKGREIKKDDKCLSASYSTRVTTLQLHFYILPVGVRVVGGANSTCTSKISSTHLTHTHTNLVQGVGVSLTEGSCRKGQRELMAGEAYTI